jgi:hypothetical protein
LAVPGRFAHGGSRLFQFDRNGKFTREIGQGIYGFLFAQQVRIDPQDNIWIVDQMAGYVMKLDPWDVSSCCWAESRRPFRCRLPLLAAGGRGGGLPGAGAESDVFNRPTDVAWDAAGNIFVADGLGNARVAKFTNKGVFVKSWGSKGTDPGCSARSWRLPSMRRAMSTSPTGKQADPGLRQQRHLQDAVHQRRRAGGAVHHPGPTQFLYSSNSNPPKTSTSPVRSTR